MSGLNEIVKKTAKIEIDENGNMDIIGPVTVGEPVNPSDATSKSYVDNLISGAVGTNAANVGTGEADVFQSKVLDTLLFRTLKQGSNITLTENPEDVTISATSSGEVNTASNVGLPGAGLFKQKVAQDLQFKCLKQGSNITLTENPEDVTISATSSGEVNTASNVGLPGAGLFKQKVAQDLQFKCLKQGSNITLTQNIDDVTVNVNGVILGGFNSGLPAAAQVYSGVGPGSQLSFKPLYSGNTNILDIGYSLDNQNIVITSKPTEQYTCYVTNIGVANSITFWNFSLSPSLITAFTLSDVVNKKIVKLCTKVLSDAAWSYTSGTIVIDIGYFPNNAVMLNANFIVLASTGLSLGVPNQSVVWNAPLSPSYLVPVLGSVAVRVTNTNVVSTNNTADAVMTLHIRDV